MSIVHILPQICEKSGVSTHSHKHSEFPYGLKTGFLTNKNLIRTSLQQGYTNIQSLIGRTDTEYTFWTLRG
jgi:hypothetical protein